MIEDYGRPGKQHSQEKQRWSHRNKQRSQAKLFHKKRLDDMTKPKKYNYQTIKKNTKLDEFLVEVD